MCCALSLLAIALYKNFPQNVLVSSSDRRESDVCAYSSPRILLPRSRAKLEVKNSHRQVADDVKIYFDISTSTDTNKLRC